MKKLLTIFILHTALFTYAQDSTVQVESKVITLSEVVVNNKLDVPSFIKRVQSDSSFHKAFKNLRILGYTAINDVRMMDKKDNVRGYLRSKTVQHRNNGCRTMETIEQEKSGDIMDDNGNFTDYTGQMYASLFFTKGKICGETNIVANDNLSLEGKSGIDKHKEQLKMLFFNPGRRIPGLPFIGKKTAIYDADIAERYDMLIDLAESNGIQCYVLKQTAKPGSEGNVVVQSMTTYFNANTMDIVARDYTLRYDAGVYDFDVNMQVEMAQFDGLTVPSVMRYIGNWKVITKKRERGIFTATLSNFNRGN